MDKNRQQDSNQAAEDSSMNPPPGLSENLDLLRHFEILKMQEAWSEILKYEEPTMTIPVVKPVDR
jgi:hypothetical protein